MKILTFQSVGSVSQNDGLHVAHKNEVDWCYYPCLHLKHFQSTVIFKSQSYSLLPPNDNSHIRKMFCLLYYNIMIIMILKHNLIMPAFIYWEFAALECHVTFDLEYSNVIHQFYNFREFFLLWISVPWHVTFIHRKSTVLCVHLVGAILFVTSIFSNFCARNTSDQSSTLPN